MPLRLIVLWSKSILIFYQSSLILIQQLFLLVNDCVSGAGYAAPPTSYKFLWSPFNEE
jgi:hypothetical protein